MTLGMTPPAGLSFSRVLAEILISVVLPTGERLHDTCILAKPAFESVIGRAERWLLARCDVSLEVTKVAG